jgi:hypothetical protein
MKKIRTPLFWIAFYGFLFITSALIGRWAGHQTRTALAFGASPLQKDPHAPLAELRLSQRADFQPKSAPILPAQTDPQIPTHQPMPDRQRNILVIGVDDLLSAEPELQSVWMVLFLKDIPHLMMMPIYPQPSMGSVSSQMLDENLASLFRLDDEKNPSAEFIQALEDRELWWTGYILLGQQALSQTLDVVAGNSPSGGSTIDALLSTIPADSLDPGVVLSSQTRLVQEMCRYSSWLSTSDTEQILGLAAQIYPHFRTDLDLEAAVAELKNTIYLGGGISCEFPSVTASINQP